MPRPANDLAALFEHVVHQRGIDVPTVDVEAGDWQLAAEQMHEVLLDRVGCFFLGPIGRCHCTGQNQSGAQISRQMAFVSVEPLALALAPVAHVLVLDRHSAIWRDTFSNPDGGDLVAAITAARRVQFKILRHHLAQRLDVFLQRGSSELVWQAVADPGFQRGQLTHQGRDGLGFVSRVAPRVVERLLDAARRQQRDACLCAHAFSRP